MGVRFERLKTAHRKKLLLLADLFLIIISYAIAWMMLSQRISLEVYNETMIWSALYFITVFFVVFTLFGMYESLWRYAEAYEFFICVIADMVATLLFVLVTWFWFRPPLVSHRIPLTVYFISAFMAATSTLFLRMGYRAFRTSKIGRVVSSNSKKVLLVGAGSTGSTVLHDLLRSPRQYQIICAVDDDPNKMGRKIHRVSVVGNTEDIPRLVGRHGIDVIFFAIPNATEEESRRILGICAQTRCQLKKVPNVSDFVNDTQSILSQLKEVSVEDLLGRNVVRVGGEDAGFLVGKTILVTGAGGSIGSELCRQIIALGAKQLIGLDICENGLYDIQQELHRSYGNHISFHAEIASVRDSNKLDLIFEKYKPDVVYHAAAHKHVPLMENVPEEAVKNNVFGTLNTAKCADAHQVERFVMISTDKAVNPTNVMGATKRVCEMIVQSMNEVSKTEFVAVRFGNVLGSNGSVIPLFRAQIAEGGPVTVTHKDIIRYFMTIPEAVSLVLTAGEMAKGGEIFVLDMGKPVKILDLAESLIRLSGYEPYQDIDIHFSGIRPGEKLFEELLLNEEGLQKTSNDKIFVASPVRLDAGATFSALSLLQNMAEGNNSAGVVGYLHMLVPEYRKVEYVTEEQARHREGYGDVAIRMEEVVADASW